MRENYELNQLRGKDIFAILDKHKDVIDQYFWKYYKNYSTKKMEEYIRDICSYFIPKGNVISIGCGHGLNEIFMADMCNDIKMILGLDIVQEKIITMNKIIDILDFENVKGDVGNAMKIGFPNESFDTVIIIESLSHVNDQYQVLKEAVRVLKNRGSIFVMDFNNGANPKILYKCWKEKYFEGIEENPVNPYYVRNRLRDLNIIDIAIIPYGSTPFYNKLSKKLSLNIPIRVNMFLTKGFMLKGKK